MNMQFVNNINNNYNSQNKQNNSAYMIQFPRKAQFNRQQQYLPESAVSVPVPVALSQNDPKKIRWGAPTWFLFHTLAHKIKDEHFSKIKLELMQNIAVICRNLPCPKCATHASEYIGKINFNAIATKDDLKNMLFKFHNEVNARTGAEAFSYSELNGKYSTAVTINIIKNFFMYFKDKSFNVTAIANSMHRERITHTLNDWFQKNIHCFDQ